MHGGGREFVRVACSRLSQFQLEIDSDVGKFLCERGLWQRRPVRYHGPQTGRIGSYLLKRWDTIDCEQASFVIEQDYVAMKIEKGDRNDVEEFGDQLLSRCTFAIIAVLSIYLLSNANNRTEISEAKHGETFVIECILYPARMNVMEPSFLLCSQASQKEPEAACQPLIITG